MASTMGSASAPKLIVSVVMASSNSGSACVRRLMEIAPDGIEIRAVFRTEAKAASLAASPRKNLSIVTGVDALSPDSLIDAFEDASAAVIVTPHDPARGMADDAALTAAMVNTAIECGVNHIVYVGSWTVGAEAALPTLAARFAPTEALLKEKGDAGKVQWTILRSGFFFPNFKAMFGSIRAGDTLRYPSVAIPPMDPADIGHVAASVLMDGPGKHHGKTYDISGPELLTTAQMAAVFEEELGRPIAHDDAPVEEFCAPLPPFLQELVRYMAAKQSSAIPLSGDVEAITGRRPKSLHEWVAENKDAFAKA